MALLFPSNKDFVFEVIGYDSGETPPAVATAGGYVSFLARSNNVKQTNTFPNTQTPVYGSADISSSGYSSFAISGDVYVSVETGTVTSVTVTAGGTGYTSAPTVGFSSGGGTGAAATAIINPSTGAVTKVWVTNGGSSYETAPTVAFTGGAGADAAATANINEYADKQLDALSRCTYLAIRNSPFGVTAASKKPYNYGTITLTSFNYEFPSNGPFKISLAGNGSGTVSRGEW